MSRDTHKNTVAILQARMGSSRLPGKIMAEVADQPMLAVIIKRIRTAKCLDTLIVATTQLPQDNCVEDLCVELKVHCFRGSENDCLDRYYQAAHQFQAEMIVRLTADNPLVDREFVDRVLQEFSTTNPPCDYLSTSLSNTYPVGLSVEVFTINALSTAWKADCNPQWREHVTPFLYHHPELFHIVNMKNPVNYSLLRWTVDTREDLEFVRKIYDHFGDTNFSWTDILEFLQKNPSLMDINKHIQQKTI